MEPAGGVIAGGGSIGLEMAAQVMEPLDCEMAAIVHRHLKDMGIDLHLSDGVEAIEEDRESGLTEVVLKSGTRLTADLVILAIGVRPEVSLAKDVGLLIGERGDIKVDEYLRTSDPSIYAVGDAIEVVDFVTGSPALMPLAGPANKQGRIADDNIAGRRERYKGSQGTAIAKIFDLTVAGTGKNEKSLKRLGVPYQASIIHSSSHARYYPGAIPLTIKILFAPDGRLLGAQVVGYDGVDKRIDVIAIAIRFGGSVSDLAELELAYAPPYGSAKDPVNIAGYVGGNILNGDMDVIHWYDIERIDELPRDKEIIIYCQVGLRAYITQRILLQSGFSKVRNLSGEYKTYRTVVEDMRSKEGSECGKHEAANEKREKDRITDSFAEEIAAADEPGGASGVVRLDACGLQCPGPIVQTFKKICELDPGDILEVHATDPGFMNDIESWCIRIGNILLFKGKDGGSFVVRIRKSGAEEISGDGKRREGSSESMNDKSMVVFSVDLDKAIASFIIATGAASMGRRVTMFFTFWGLNILRKNERVRVKKGLVERMFGIMMPKGSRRLGLSKLNMGGIGPRVIRAVMKSKNVDSLEALIEQAMQMGIHLVACRMSMDVMGIKRKS